MLPVHTTAHLGLVARMHKYCKGIKIKDDIIWHHKRGKFLEKQHKYPHFLHIIRILLICPVSTAQAERQFSSIKHILGDWRLKLKTGTIKDLLRICTEGPEITGFCPESAVLRWWSSGRFSGRPIMQSRSIAETSDSELEYDSSQSECIQSSQCTLGHPAFQNI